jgi:flagellar biosynthesis protein FliR
MIISIGQLSVFILIMTRILGIILTAPFLNSRTFFSLAKITAAFWISMVFWFVVPISVQEIPVTWGALTIGIITQLTIGLTIGFLCDIIFLSIQAAGEIIDLQMGLSVATAMDPSLGRVISIVGRMTFFLALVVFINVNGHHMLLSALFNSFRAIPLGMPINISNPMILEQVFSVTSLLWMTAIKLAAPAILIIFLSDFSFGIVSKVAPQVNVFMLGFQVKPSLGLIAIMFGLAIYVKHFVSLIERMAEEVIKVISYLQFIK